MMPIIYKAQYISKDGKIYIYIGKTGQETLGHRIAQHKSQAKSMACPPESFHRYMVNFGVENWDWEKLIECDISEENDKEMEWLDVYLQEDERNPVVTVLNNAGVNKLKKSNKRNTNRYNLPRSNLPKNLEKVSKVKDFREFLGS